VDILRDPDEDSIEAMHRAWRRADLTRYLARWAETEVPPIPPGFLDYAYRVCDIGCGFGRYLIRESTRHPDRGYLGIDKGSLRGGKMCSRFAATGNANLFGLHTNVIPVLAAMPESLLHELTIFYPNPWWPAKHRKKRWSYHPLLPRLIDSMVPLGTLTLTSNEAFYLREWRYALTHHPEVADRVEVTYAGPIRETEGRTHFEVKFIEEGTPCGEVTCRKR